MTKIPSDNFLTVINANVNDKKLSDKEFRELIEQTLPNVDYKDTSPKVIKVTSFVHGTKDDGHEIAHELESNGHVLSKEAMEALIYLNYEVEFEHELNTSTGEVKLTKVDDHEIVDVEKLRESFKKFNSLLSSPEPGISSWCGMVNERVKEIKELLSL